MSNIAIKVENLGKKIIASLHFRKTEKTFVDVI